MNNYLALRLGIIDLNFFGKDGSIKTVITSSFFFGFKFCGVKPLHQAQVPATYNEISITK